jgi:hypothetical protein
MLRNTKKVREIQRLDSEWRPRPAEEAVITNEVRTKLETAERAARRVVSDHEFVRGRPAAPSDRAFFVLLGSPRARDKPSPPVNFDVGGRMAERSKPVASSRLLQQVRQALAEYFRRDAGTCQLARVFVEKPHERVALT